MNCAAAQPRSSAQFSKPAKRKLVSDGGAQLCAKPGRPSIKLCARVEPEVMNMRKRKRGETKKLPVNGLPHVCATDCALRGLRKQR